MLHFTKHCLVQYLSFLWQTIRSRRYYNPHFSKRLRELPENTERMVCQGWSWIWSSEARRYCHFTTLSASLWLSLELCFSESYVHIIYTILKDTQTLFFQTVYRHSKTKHRQSCPKLDNCWGGLEARWCWSKVVTFIFNIVALTFKL